MKTLLIGTLLVCIALALCAGLVRYRILDRPMRIVVWYMALQLISEIAMAVTATTGQFDLRAVLLNTYNVVEMCVVSGFYILVVKPVHYEKVLIVSIFFWPAISGLNILFLQSYNELNSNFLMLESFSIMTMSLFCIYTFVKKPVNQNMFRHPHFRVSLILLLMWCSSLFFWAFIKVLYQHQWQYANAAMYAQVMMNCILTAAIGLVLFFYPKQQTRENR